ncbi:diadenylate cyclase CdaA [Carboxylicivirga marina]|uniref:Diadenylate cyclase n=1 Tax=Carboxylicivirga marina TaxID=2800988 RepID=A0ABS1HHY3_9BACT|nr:diadenylate cyclase CdaA [Carboxylicivirga marina]MBK3516814.1 TIGR00159 family protein [Carboxylicivirga marina]
MTFLDIRFIDLVDIVLVAYLMFRIYKLIKGTVALNIMIGIAAFGLFWFIINIFNMQLSTSIMDKVVSVGVIAFIVVFQQEIRRFLLLLGSRYNVTNRFSMDKVFVSESKGMMSIYNKPVVRACVSLAKTKTGALIVITKNSELLDYVQTGELINGVISTQLIENIFFKNSPLHDGAVIITGNKIKAAGCILPVSQNTALPKRVGLRHRAAMGITESTDAHAIVVSEETGRISFFSKGQMEMGVTDEELQEFLNKS